MKTIHAALLGASLALAAAPAAFAQSDMKGPPDMKGMPGMSHADQGAAKSPADEAYLEANMKMHEGMNVALSGDADADFLRSMIPHHQGAVEMAEIVLRYGKDPQVKKLAEEIVAAQKREIAEMTAKLAAFEKAGDTPK